MKKLIILIAVFSAVILAAIFFLNTPSKNLSNQQKEQAMTNLLGRKPNLGNSNEPKGDTQFKGHFVSFKYPARAKIYVLKVNGEVKKDNWNLDSLNFDLDDPRSSTLITVSDAPNGVTSLNDYPSIKLRQAQPGLYQGKEITVSGQSGMEFDKKDNTSLEKTAFFYIKGRIYVFSITGSDVSGIEDLFKQIMSSVKFLS